MLRCCCHGALSLEPAFHELGRACEHGYRGPRPNPANDLLGDTQVMILGIFSAAAEPPKDILHLPSGREEDGVEGSHGCERGSHTFEEASGTLLCDGLLHCIHG